MALNPWKGIPYVEEFLNSLGILIRRNNTNVGKQPALNFIEGSQIGITAVEDSINQEVDVTINLLPNNPIQFGDLILRGTIANRPSPNIDGRLYFSTDENKLYRDSGAAWQQMIVDESTPITYGTSFPSSPKDGDIHVLVDSTTAPAYQWQFRYNANSSHSEKWEFIGGSPARAFIATEESTTSTSYTDLTTVGPSVTVPYKGLYLVTMDTYTRDSSGNALSSCISVKIGTAATSTDQEVKVDVGFNKHGPLIRTQTITVPNDNTELRMQYKRETASGTPHWKNRTLIVSPIRIG